MSGQSFSTIHRDLITEVTMSREVKVRVSLMMGRYSTSDQTNDTFIKTNHAMAKIRSKMKQHASSSSNFHFKDRNSKDLASSVV